MNKIQNEISEGLVYSALEYGRAGLVLYRSKSNLGRRNQAALGNLAIAIELLLKALIAKKSLLLIYVGLPIELRCALATPGALPESFKKAKHIIELKASVYKTIELDEAISAFSVYYPDLRKHLGSHLKHLARNRNTCLHGILPDCKEYEVERTVFIFLTLVKELSKEDSKASIDFYLESNGAENRKFLEQFSAKRIESVHSKIEAAKERSKKLTEIVELKPSSWETYPVECPICGSDGILHGDTREDYDVDEDGIPNLGLTFIGDSFECGQCGLKLEDYDELKGARVAVEHDRSDESTRWIEEHYDDTLYSEYL